eukprot:scaffold7896_cov14-Tisochrysis_lutea.AAC.1
MCRDVSSELQCVFIPGVFTPLLQSRGMNFQLRFFLSTGVRELACQGFRRSCSEENKVSPCVVSAGSVWFFIVMWGEQ